MATHSPRILQQFQQNLLKHKALQLISEVHQQIKPLYFTPPELKTQPLLSQRPIQFFKYLSLIIFLRDRLNYFSQLRLKILFFTMANTQVLTLVRHLTVIFFFFPPVLHKATSPIFFFLIIAEHL